MFGEIKEIKIERSPEGNSRSGQFPIRTMVKVLGGILALVIVVAIAALFLLVRPAYQTYRDAMKLNGTALELKDAAKVQDLEKTKAKLSELKTQLGTVETDLGALSWTKAIPFLGNYTADAFHLTKAGKYGIEAGEILVSAVEPYSDILGLKGKGTFSGGTVEDRIVTVVQTLDKVTPQVDAIAEKLELTRKEIDQIDANRYPENFQGKPIRSRITDIKTLVDISGDFLTEARPMVKQLPQLLGATTEKKYLVLFQNDAELRPTGGFITAYAVFRVQKGKINIDTSDDIYKLDQTITRKPAPPAAIAQYLREPVWNIRNANFSPDFGSSMNTFMTMYNTSTDKKKIDGIIAMDTHVLLKLMEVLGPIPAYGTNFTTEKVAVCDCPMIIWELEKYADEPKGYERGSRKDIIGVLLQSMMQKAMGAPRQLWGSLFQTAFTEMEQKHILFYLLDADAQKGVLALGAGGEIKNYQGDYLHINDANLGGAKSNLYITEAVTQEVTVKPEGTETNLVIEYRYPRRADNCSLERKEGVCLAGTNRDYLRVYLPAGSTLLEARGYENKNTTFDDLGKTVVDGFFDIFPQSIKKIQIRYKTPVKFSGEYKELIQKQPGTENNHYKVSVNGQVQEFDLVTDKEISLKL